MPVNKIDDDDDEIEYIVAIIKLFIYLFIWASYRLFYVGFIITSCCLFFFFYQSYNDKYELLYYRRIREEYDIVSAIIMMIDDWISLSFVLLLHKVVWSENSDYWRKGKLLQYLFFWWMTSLYLILLTCCFQNNSSCCSSKELSVSSVNPGCWTTWTNISLLTPSTYVTHHHVYCIYCSFVKSSLLLI